jgi:hypothetical protein
MTVLLFRQYDVERPELDQDEEPTGEMIHDTEWRVVGDFPDLDLAKERMRADAAEEV